LLLARQSERRPPGETADVPALPLDEAGKYVAGAYVTFFVLVVVYVAIIGSKIARIDRELEELADLVEERTP
jgi:hypothetical protein